MGTQWPATLSGAPRNVSAHSSDWGAQTPTTQHAADDREQSEGQRATTAFILLAVIAAAMFVLMLFMNSSHLWRLISVQFRLIHMDGEVPVCMSQPWKMCMLVVAP